MRTLLQLAAVLALLTFCAGTAVLVFYGVRVLKDFDAGVRHADAALTAIQGEWQNEKADVHQIVVYAKETAEQADAFTHDQRIQLQKTSRDSDNQVRSLGLVTRNAEKFFYNLDQQVNWHVLPDFDRELVSTSTAAQFSFESLTKAGDALAFQINDPAIPQMLESFNAAARSFADASAKADDSLGHVDHTFAYYDKKLTTPLGFWKTLGKSLLSTGSQAGNIYGGFIK